MGAGVWLMYAAWKGDAPVATIDKALRKAGSTPGG